nr:hypothetical protein [Kribbella qitaiheensis]
MPAKIEASGVPTSPIVAMPCSIHSFVRCRAHGRSSVSVSIVACASSDRRIGPSVQATSTQPAPATYACSTTARAISS